MIKGFISVALLYFAAIPFTLFGMSSTWDSFNFEAGNNPFDTFTLDLATESALLKF